MSFTGMDIPAVRTLATTMNRDADQVHQLMTQLTHQLQSTPWHGPDRERFLSEWQSTHVARLTSVVNALHEAAQRATANANEQEQVSSR